MIKKIYLFLLIFSIATQAVKEVGSPEEYDIFFRTLIGEHGLKLAIHTDEQSIFISGLESEIKELEKKLREVLSAREALEKSLNYSIGHENGAVASGELWSFEEGRAKLETLFGNALSDLTVDAKALFSEQEGARIEEGSLYSKKFPNRSIKTYENYSATFLSYLEGNSPSEIRQAWAEGEALSLDDENEFTAKDMGNSLNMLIDVRACCDKYSSLRFDLPGIYNLCHELQMNMEVKEAQAVLVIDKSSLIAQLKSLLFGDALLRVVKDAEEMRAYPIILREKKSLSTSLIHYLVIDRSGSMGDEMSNLKAYLNNYIDHLFAANPQAKIQLVSFSSDAVFSLPYGIEDMPVIKEQVAKLKAAGGTRLFSTVEDVIKCIRVNQASSDAAITLFTDGDDTCGDKASLVENALLPMALSERPSSLTLGLGPKVDPNLHCLAEKTGGKYFPIKNLGEFNKILAEEAEEHSRKRTLMQFFMKLGEEIIPAALLNAPQDQADIFMPEISFSVNESTQIICGNQSMSSFNKKAGDETLFDALKNLSSHALSLATNMKIDRISRLMELRQLAKRVVELAEQGTSNDQKYAATVNEKIGGYIRLTEQASPYESSNALKVSIARLTGIYE